MGYRSKIRGRPASAFVVGDWVITRSGLKAQVIGAAEYPYGWEYRLKVLGRRRTFYRREHELAGPV